MRLTRFRRRPNPPIDLKALTDLDADSIKVLNRYAKRGREHAEIMRRVRPILARNGYTLGEELGSGSAATVYTLADFPEYVAKITYDPTDAAIMSEFSTLPDPPPPGLPEVVTVAALGDGLYLIVMERLEPLSASQQRPIDALARKLAYGYEIMQHPSLWKAWRDKPNAPQHAYLNALRFVHALGYNAYDIGEDNVMRRPSDKSLVVSDFGFSSPRRGEAVRQDVPRLRNPRTRLPARLRTTRRNPVIDLSGFDASLGRMGVNSNNRREMALAAPDDADALKVLARNGFDLGSRIGTGTAASVYEVVGDPRWVMKITADATDAAVMAELQFAPRDAQGRLPPGIPEVGGVYDLGNGLYGILVEYLLPLSRSEAADVADMMFSSQFGWYHESVEARYNALSPNNPLRAVLNAILVVYALGFRMSDISDNNVMRRENGDLVVSDFGYAGVELDKRRYSRDIYRLKNPAPEQAMSIFDDYDFVVTPSSSRNQFWVPTGEGNGVRPVRVTYESLKVEVFPVGSPRTKEARLGGVSGTASFSAGTRDRLRDTTCERDFQALAARHPDLRGVVSVGSSFLPEALRGKGMGLAAYRLLVEHAGKMGLAVVPHYCDTGTPVTSADALRVWDKLVREPGFDAEGRVVYAPLVKANPRRRR
jgi:serine/threonine protein kinase